MEDQRPPVLDGGRQAWLFLIASVTIEGLLYGFQASYGVLLEFYRTNASFGNDPFLPFVGLLGIGMQKLGAPVITPLIIRNPTYRTHLIWAGWIICVVSLVASSCASEVWHLALSIGVGFSLGLSILYYPMLNMLNDWWIKRRGFAYGIQLGLAGIISAVLPFALAPMLEALGSSWTLLAYAGIVFFMSGLPILLFRSPTLTQVTAGAQVLRMDSAVLRRTCFTAMTFSNVFQGLVYSYPTIYLPVYVSAVGLSSIQGIIILAIANLAVSGGQLGTGYLVDIIDSRILMAVFPLLSGLIVFGFWGLGHSLIRLISFAILFGLFSGGYIVLYSRFATTLAEDRPTQTWLYTIFDVQRGVVVIVGGAIGSSLVRGPVIRTEYGVGQYKVLIIFCGVCFLVAALSGIAWFFRGRSFYMPRRWRRTDGVRVSVGSSASMDRLLSVIEHHIWLDAEKGALQQDDGTHQRYLKSIRQALQRQRTMSVSTFVSRSSLRYEGGFCESTMLQPPPLSLARSKKAAGKQKLGG